MKLNAEQIQKLCKKWLILFLAAILALTFLTRVLDSILIPKVEIIYPKGGSLTYKAEGIGTLEPEEVYAVKVEQGVVIRRLLASIGESVTVGTPLFSYQMDDLEEAAEKKSVELEKLKLDLEGEILNSRPLPKMTEAELAAQTLEKTQEIFEHSSSLWENAQKEYTENVERTKGRYEENRKKSKDEILETRKRESILADQEYETSLLDEKAAVKEAKWQLTDAERRLDELMSSGANETELESARSEVSRQKQKLALVEMTWEIATEKAYNTKLEKNNSYASMLEGGDNTLEAIEEEYKNKLDALKDELEAAEESYLTSERALKDARQSLANAKINDQNAEAGQIRSEEFSLLKQKSIGLSIEEAEKELLRIHNMIQAGGVVCSPCNGTLTKLALTPGERSAGSEQILIGSGGLLLKSDLDIATAKQMAAGAEVEFKLGKKPIKEKGILKSVDLQNSKDEAVIMISLPDSSLLPGTQLSYTCESKSEEYGMVLPIDAIRSDNSGDYILAVQEKDTILGKEEAAFRVNVTVLSRSKDSVAVEGAVTYSTEIITKSSKNIVDGDRVRKVVK